MTDGVTGRRGVIALMGAMDVEVAAIRQAICQPRLVTVLGCEITSGLLDGRPVLLAESGIGKVNASLTTAALAQAGATSLVFVGVAGGVGPGIQVGDAVVATSLVQHDVDITVFGHAPGVISGVLAGGVADSGLSDALAAGARALNATVHRGIIASGDQFITSPDRAAAIAQQFDAMAVEMEGAAVAQVCTRLGLPFAVLRWISDTADGHAETDFGQFVQKIAQLDLAVVKQLLSTR